MIGAASGAVGIFPDYIGYGELQNFNRSYLAKLPYAQSAVVSFFATKRSLLQGGGGGSSSSGGGGVCTPRLDTEVTVMGYSEGGMAAIAGAQALKRVGVKVVKVFASGGSYDLQTVLKFGLDSFINGEISADKDNRITNLVLGFLVFAYSIDLPFLANSGTGQYAASNELRDEIIEWYGAPDPLTTIELVEVVPLDLSIVNQQVVGVIAVHSYKLENQQNRQLSKPLCLFSIAVVLP